MALINTAGYENLAKMATITETKKPGKFFNVNISSRRRIDYFYQIFFIIYF